MYIMFCENCNVQLNIPEAHEGGFLDGESVNCNNCGHVFVLNSQNIPGIGRSGSMAVFINVLRGKMAFKNASANVKALMVGAGMVAYGLMGFVAGHIMGDGIFWALGLIFRKLLRSVG